MAAQKTSKELKIDAEAVNPRKRLFFNSYAIRKDKIPGFAALEFAFVQSGEVLDTFFCVVALADIEQQRDSFLHFHQTLEGGESLPPVTLPSFSRPQAVEIADFIGMARNGVQGEIIFHAFSWKVLVDKGRLPKDATGSPAATATFVALLRCHFSILRRFIAELFDDSHEEKTRNQKRR